MKPLLIGLSGKAGSGKNTAADYLTQKYGYHQLAFADPLKAAVQRAFYFTADQMLFRKEIIDERCGKSPRWCLQHFGSAFREVWPEIWVWNLRQNILDRLSLFGEQPIVVTDVRFKNEAEALLRLGAVLVRIERREEDRLEACATGIPDHISETDLDGWEGWNAAQGNHTWVNDGTVENLYDVLDMILVIEANKRWNEG